MELKVLGCHGGETPKHRTSSFLINDHLALDAGAITSQLSLGEQQQIKAVAVSHAHLDHIRDLAPLVDNRCQQGGPGLEILGTAATLKELKRHFFNDRLWPDFSKIETAGAPTITYRTLRPEKPTQVAGLTLKPVQVDHTIDTAAFVVSDDQGSIAYSGDTGPTERLWQVLNETPDLRALLMEVSFPNEQTKLAIESGHHTPRTLAKDLKKLKQADLPILLFHIKPVFEAKVEQQLAKIKKHHLTVMNLGDQFLF